MSGTDGGYGATQYGLRTPLSLDNFTAIAKNCSEVRFFSALSPNPSALSPNPARFPQSPVSYTHLTLPTICSV
eukprot:2152990-Rhodomonas_salina.2